MHIMSLFKWPFSRRSHIIPEDYIPCMDPSLPPDGCSAIKETAYFQAWNSRSSDPTTALVDTDSLMIYVDTYASCTLSPDKTHFKYLKEVPLSQVCEGLNNKKFEGATIAE